VRVNCECNKNDDNDDDDIAEWAGQQRGSFVECCEAGRLLATAESTCNDGSRDHLSHDLVSDDRSHCAVVREVCCLAERRHVRCRRGVNHVLTVTATFHNQQQQQHDCQHLSDDAKVLSAVLCPCPSLTASTFISLR